LDDPDAVADLIAIARNETNADLRKNAMFWLGQSSDPRAAEFLAEVIGR
jgi:antitoxin (DNA-binding transcriptional repressor) of toxin-antitoxin stability system